MAPPSDAQIDAGAQALRDHDMAGLITRSWADLPNGDKKKWRLKAEIVLTAALRDA